MQTKLEFHQLAADYPLMPDAELQLMVEDMRANGYDTRFPIVVYEGQVLDGRNRWIAAEQAGVEPLLVTLPEGADPAVFVQRANEHRRHLDTEWLQRRRAERVERVAAARQEGKSLRVIAEEEGVSKTQVIEDLKAATGQGCPVDPSEGRVTGRDGRTRTAKPKQPADTIKEWGESGRIGKRAVAELAEGKSLRVIAEEEGVSKTQVIEDLKAATGQGCPVDPSEGRVTGRDGRTRTAKPKQPADTIKEWGESGRIGKRAVAELAAVSNAQQKEFIRLVEAGTCPSDALKAISREPGDDKLKPTPTPRKPPVPREEIHDQAGNVVPDHLRDAFADTGLADLIEELEQVEAMIRPDPWLSRVSKLCDHYGFILVAKFKEHAWESLSRLQLALEALRAGLPHAICPKCHGTDSKQNGKVCRGCRGYGHVPETRFRELQEAAS